MTDITFNAGKGNKISLIYKDSAGVVIDITAATARMMARNSYYQSAVLTKAAVITGAEGKIAFDFVSADTNSILVSTKEEKFLYDVELTLSGEEPIIIMSGELTIKQVVTRD